MYIDQLLLRLSLLLTLLKRTHNHRKLACDTIANQNPPVCSNKLSLKQCFKFLITVNICIVEANLKSID